MAVGAVLLAAALLLNLAALRRAARDRRVRAGFNTVTYAVLLLAVWAMLNWINSRHYHRFDVTFSKQFTIAPQTRAVLEGIDKPLAVTTLLRPGTMLYRQVLDLLKGYEAVSSLVKVKHIDVERDYAAAEMLARRLDSDLALDSVVFEYGDQSKHVTVAEMQEMDLSGYQYGTQTPPKFKGEEAFTSAIMELAEDKRTRLYFVTGHGERSVEGRDRGSFMQAAGVLKRNNMEVETLKLLGAESVPEDCDVLVVAGPRKRYAERELEVMDGYLAGGGKLLVMIDPVEDTGLKGFLGKWGVDMGEDVVIDPSSSIPFVGPTTLLLGEYPRHDITEPLRGLATVFSLARSMGPGSAGSGGLSAASLAETSRESWAETDLENPEARYDEGPDVKGPVSIAVAVSAAGASPYPGAPPDPAGSKTRLVAVGDADFAADGQIDTAGNSDFFLNSINWLAEKEKLISISPRSPDIRTVTPSLVIVGEPHFLSSTTLRPFGPSVAFTARDNCSTPLSTA